VIDLVLDVLSGPPLAADEVAAFEVTTFGDTVNLMGIKCTTAQSNHVDAHMSMPYCVAATLIDGEMTPRQLLKERPRDPRVHELASRVRATEDPAMTSAFPNEWPARIVIRLRSEEAIERRIDKVASLQSSASHAMQAAAWIRKTGLTFHAVCSTLPFPQSNRST